MLGEINRAAAHLLPLLLAALHVVGCFSPSPHSVYYAKHHVNMSTTGAMSTDLPSPERLQEIKAIQERKESEGLAAKEQHTTAERQAAAELIQRNYRGYRARRELKGYALSSSERWSEVYHTLVLPFYLLTILTDPCSRL